jgi:hypothetical protein
MSTATASDFRSETEPAACFSIHAEAEPWILPRLLELFAKRGIVPASWISRVTGSEISVDIQVHGIDAELTGYIARCARQIVGVTLVLTSEKQ